MGRVRFRNRKRLLQSRGIPWIAALLLVWCVSALPLSADTIFLKNGRAIVAEAITETGDKIYYEGEGGRVSLPKSMVDRIEKGGPLPVRRSPTPTLPVEQEKPSAELPPAIRLTLDSKLMQSIILDGAVDDRKLAELASKASDGEEARQQAVNAYLLASAYEARAEHLGEANRWAEEALKIDAFDRNALLLASQIDLTLRKYNEALQHMLVAQGMYEQSPDVLTLLGDAYYFSEGAEKAVRFWKQAQTLRPDPKLADRIQRAEKEAEVESGLEQAESYHFLLSWQGSELPQSFGKEVLESLEQSFRELEVALDYSPRESIPVILYGSQQFGDITRSPGWAGALNDGKIRVPVQGLTSLSPELARVLKHELTHSFIHQIASGRCPTWLNEGIAQLEAGESYAAIGPELARRFAASRQIPLTQLEGSYRRLNAGQALMAYSESLAAVEMIRDQYGDYYLPKLLQALGAGQSLELSLKSVLRIDYTELETELAAYLARLYIH
jgi:peptidase MA superfamily protein